MKNEMLGEEYRNSKQYLEQVNRERFAVSLAKATGKSITYIDKDGCEVTATPSGHVFLNAADWW